LNPSLPATATAIIINNSGIPKASKPETAVFHPVDKSDDVTIGINSGDKNPVKKIIPAVISFPLGGRLSVILLFSSTSSLYKEKFINK
jgi:hypothetical protein